MKREDLWVLLGEAPTEMIEEASTAPTGKKVLWLRRVLPLAAAVVLLSATALVRGNILGGSRCWGQSRRSLRRAPSRLV